MVSGGWYEQPVSPASARDAPISFRNVRRSAPSSHSGACCGNSRWRSSSNSFVPDSSSRLCQYSRPRLFSSFARTPSTETGRCRIWYSSGKVSLMCILLILSALSVARRAARDGRRAADAVLALELEPQLAAPGRQVLAEAVLRVGRHPVRRVALDVPAHVGDLLLGAQVTLGLAVAGQAPLHLERGGLVDGRHRVHAPVAGGAAHALVDVDRVVEVDEVGQVVDSRPLDGLVVAVAGADDLQVRALVPDLRVAVHAGLGRRHPGRVRRLDRGVAVAAVDAVVADVVLVRELDGLLHLDELARVVGGAVDLGEHPERGGDEEDAAEDADLGDGVGAVVENLHALPRTRLVTLGTSPARRDPRTPVGRTRAPPAAFRPTAG